MRITVLLSVCILIAGLLSSLLLASVARDEALGQLVYVILGVGLFWCVQAIPSHTLLKLTYPAYIGVLLLLLLTVTVGKVSKGSMRWIPIGPVHIQPSEFAKPVLALAVSTAVVTGIPWIQKKSHIARKMHGFLFWGSPRWMVRGQQIISRHQEIIFLLLLTGGLGIPVFIQPDLGSAMVLFATGALAVFLTVKHLRMLIPWVIGGVSCLFLIWNFGLYEYQKMRITSFFQADTLQASSAYNARQALIAVGSGKLLGRGLGHGVQSTLAFLPEHHTDFFFASYAEEMGFLGVLALFGLYGAIFVLCFWKIDRASSQSNLYVWLYCGGLFIQAVIHIGMNMHVVPVTGIPLPLLSSGGSSFVATAIGLGLVARLRRIGPDVESEALLSKHDRSGILLHSLGR